MVVTPTYNEKESLPSLADKIFSLGISNLELWVVDDNSPDGTGKLAQELSRRFPILVLHRAQKEGLGRAYVNAFQEVLRADEKPDFIIQMDADLSHDPDAIPRLLQKAQNCDLVLGSRYVKGGKIVNWGTLRRLISFLGNLYARLVLGLPLRDLTGGFKCWRRGVLETFDFDNFSSTGYNFQIETTYKTYRQGFKICEIPITFTERKIGVSKFNLGIILESFIKVLLLRLYG